MQKSSKVKGHKNMLTKLLIGAAGVAAGYFGAMYLVSFAMVRDPKRVHDLVDRAQERVKEARARRRQRTEHQPFEAVQRYSDSWDPMRPTSSLWNPTHPTDPASR